MIKVVLSQFATIGSCNPRRLAARLRGVEIGLPDDAARALLDVGLVHRSENLSAAEQPTSRIAEVA